MNWEKILKKFGFGWTIKRIMWRLDSSKPSNKWLHEFLAYQVQLAQTEKRLPKYTGTEDQKAMKCFKWVAGRIGYESDFSQFGVRDKYEDINIILTNKKADCESMACLLFAMLRQHGISPLKVKFSGGLCYTPRSKKTWTGHAWLEYAPDGLYDYESDKQRWIILDAAYDPKNIIPFNKRQLSNKDNRYKRIYFEATDILK